MEEFKTISNNVEAEIVEKKSKFIAHVFYIESVEEAEAYIKEMKKKYHDARHNVFAYDDWNEQKQGREEYGKTKVISNVHNGAIILLHANSVDNSNILDSCIKEIKNMGYEFKSLDEFKL